MIRSPAALLAQIEPTPTTRVEPDDLAATRDDCVFRCVLLVFELVVCELVVCELLVCELVARELLPDVPAPAFEPPACGLLAAGHVLSLIWIAFVVEEGVAPECCPLTQAFVCPLESAVAEPVAVPFGEVAGPADTIGAEVAAETTTQATRATATSDRPATCRGL